MEQTGDSSPVNANTYFDVTESTGSLLRHVAVIPDGNRRWAKLNGRSISETYDTGIRKIKDVAEWCREFNIKTLTMWGLSTDNLKRGKNELSTLFNLFKKYLLDTDISQAKDEKNKVRIRFYGRIDTLPGYIQDGIHYVENETKDSGPYRLNLLLGYGGKEEIVDAVNRIINSGVKSVDKHTFPKYLYGIGEPDLLIRTSGTMRLSGFMPWELAYTELYFSDKLWPDFSKKDFIAAITDYKRRKRKFGK